MIKVLIIRTAGKGDASRIVMEEKIFPFRKEAIDFIDGLKKSKVERTSDGYRVTLE